MPSFVAPRSTAAQRRAAEPPRGGRGWRRLRGARPADGLPEGLQTVMEAMSGFSLADVAVQQKQGPGPADAADERGGNHRLGLAGAAGFEPANAGTKNRIQPSEGRRNLRPIKSLGARAGNATKFGTQIGTQIR